MNAFCACATVRSVLLRALLASSMVMISCAGALAQSSTALSEAQVWPEADAHIEFPSHLRLLVFSGVQQGVDYPYQQWYSSAGLGYQFKPIRLPHLVNIDPDKEFHFLAGAGYEFLRTIQSGKVKNEDRIIVEMTFSFRLPSEFLLQDRNRVEFRWVNGAYSTRYRNLLFLERDFLLHGFRFSPYGSAEVFYDISKNSWDEEWYTAGIQWPYKHIFMLDTYYQRQNCPTCNPAYWNVAGLTLNFYFGNRK
ncbi:MAG: DUF2490 domain-containing protein [Acidobacteriaceae bacterium]|nr:DUF2490 domain-containing protein [Acidobacteriaceae bacterium]